MERINSYFPPNTHFCLDQPYSITAAFTFKNSVVTIFVLAVLQCGSNFNFRTLYLTSLLQSRILDHIVLL